MSDRFIRPDRGERLIAAARVVLALFSLFATVVDPIDPAKHLRLIYLVIAFYSIYSILLVVLAHRLQSTERYRLLTHIADIIFFTCFIFFTYAPASPFFVFFFFSLLCATIRFGLRGVIVTAISVWVIFVTVGLGELTRETGYELNRFIVRMTYLAVSAWLLIYLASYLRRLHSELAGLAAWPRTAPKDRDELVRDTLLRAAEPLGVPRVVLVWSEKDEPWQHIAIWTARRFECLRESADRFLPFVPRQLHAATFYCANLEQPETIIIRSDDETFSKRITSVLNSDFAKEFSIRTVLSTSLIGQTFEGRIFYLDRGGMTADDVRLSEILARLIAARLDQFYLALRAEEAAVAEERLRLARDLHDGLLQSLTATSLQLAAAQRLLQRAPAEASQRLAETSAVITSAHEELRSFIQKLRPADGTGEQEFRLHARLKALAVLVERNWGPAVEFRVDAAHNHLAETTNMETYRLIHEAVVNAAKHASAKRILVETKLVDHQLAITISDDGRGFPFEGTFDLASLHKLRRGPLTLKERVSSLHGDLLLTSAASGSRLEIKVPLQS